MKTDFISQLTDFFNSSMFPIHTAMPARVIRVDDVERARVDVQPLSNMVFPDGEDFERPIILGVPLQMPGSSTSLVNIPVKQGDIVLCVFSMRGLDAFKAGAGTPAAPTDFRMFDKRDAIAIPGIFPFDMHPNLKRVLPFNPDALSLTQDIGLPTESIVELSDAGIALKQGATSVVVSSAGVALKQGATSVVVSSAGVALKQGATSVVVSSAGVEITGLLTINGVPFPSHTHSGVTTGTASSGPVSI